MTNQVASKQTTNIVPVQGVFDPGPNFAIQYLVGPAGTTFYAPTNPIQSGLTITNSVIDSSVIGGSTPSAAYFTTAQVSAAPSSATDVANKEYVDSVVTNVTDDATTNATFYPLFANQTTGNLTTGYTSSTKLKFNPSTGVFTATGGAGGGNF